MPSGDAPDGFNHFLAFTVLGARVGFSGGFALIIAAAAAALVPPEGQAVVYSVAGATSVLVLWRVTGRIFGRARSRRRD